MPELYVGGNTNGAVRSAVRNKLRIKYDSKRGRLSDRLTDLVLEYYRVRGRHRPDYSPEEQIEAAQYYVKENYRPVGFVEAAVWWALGQLFLKLVVPLVIEWLFSEESMEWRVNYE